MVESKKCVACSLLLPRTEFWSKGEGRLDTNCKACRKKKNDEYRAKNRDKVRAAQREWDRKNSKKISDNRKKRLGKLTPEELKAHRERERKNQRAMRERRITAYIEEHGSAPSCKCGCGEPVNFNDKGIANKYVNHHQPSSNSLELYRDGIPTIPIEKFRDVFIKMKKDKGWTLNEMADKGGVSPTHLSDLLYNKTKYKRHGISEEWVRHFLNRLYGKAAPPSSYMLKQKAKIDERYRSTDVYNYERKGRSLGSK